MYICMFNLTAVELVVMHFFHNGIMNVCNILKIELNQCPWLVMIIGACQIKDEILLIIVSIS